MPTRDPDSQEATLLDQLALALIEYGTDSDLITLASRPTSTSAVGRTVIDRTQETRNAAVRKRIPRQRSGRGRVPPGG